MVRKHDWFSLKSLGGRLLENNIKSPYAFMVPFGGHKNIDNLEKVGAAYMHLLKKKKMVTDF